MTSRIEWKVPGDTAEWDRNRIQGVIVVDSAHSTVEEMK
jgi:hypothetical protein